MSGERTRVADLIPSDRLEDLRYAYGRARGYACAKLRLDGAAARDVVDRAMLRAIERLDQFQERPGKTFDAWFRKILTNFVRDEHRHRERTQRLRDAVDTATRPPTIPPPDVLLINAQAKMRRDQIVSQLSQANRIVFEVWAQQNAGYIDRTEAASRLGMTIEQYEAAKKRVETAVENAMKRLRFQKEDLWSEMPVAAGANSGREEQEP
jgi:RNA polymerase sigma factor (sigma-70 family)